MAKHNVILALLAILLPLASCTSAYEAEYLAQRLTLLDKHEDAASDICNDYTDKAQECRAKNCFYDCSNGWCSKEKPTCAAVMGCSADSCFDMCKCRGQGCQYNMGNSRCRNYTDNNCRPNAFSPLECVRADTFYSIGGGEICYHRGPTRGPCDIDSTSMAINLMGPAHTDVHDVDYYAHGKFAINDPHKLQANTTSRDFSGRPEQDRVLYTTILTANSNGHVGGQCIKFEVGFEYDGNYEVSLKLLEGHFDAPGKRYFTVKLNGISVFPEIDLWSLVQGRGIAFDLNLNLYVYDGYIYVKGFQPIELDEESWATLDLCIGECNNSYVKKFYVGAFSVVKMKEGILQKDSGRRYGPKGQTLTGQKSL